MKPRRIARRAFIVAALAATPLALYADADELEPNWVKTRFIKMSAGKLSHRVVQISDIHHKGDVDLFKTVVKKVNALAPDIVCFTGDLIEHREFVPEALGILGGIKSPIYGIPGNHDYWSGAHFADYFAAFAATGGWWLMDMQRATADGKVLITGVTCLHGTPLPLKPRPGVKNILLLHYPLMAERVTSQFDLMLAGHSHGGQVRVPFYGALMLPYWVGKYEVGMFHLKAGPLYVNPGIGWIGTPLRFNCRPEITVFDI